MAFTTHGHQIPGTPVEEEKPTAVARCGGVGGCAVCATDAARAWANQYSIPVLQDLLFHTEETMFKVFFALKKVGITDNQALDAINEMQNAGILFRERIE